MRVPKGTRADPDIKHVATARELSHSKILSDYPRGDFISAAISKNWFMGWWGRDLST